MRISRMRCFGLLRLLGQQVNLLSQRSYTHTHTHRERERGEEYQEIPASTCSSVQPNEPFNVSCPAPTPVVEIGDWELVVEAVGGQAVQYINICIGGSVEKISQSLPHLVSLAVAFAILTSWTWPRSFTQDAQRVSVCICRIFGFGIPRLFRHQVNLLSWRSPTPTHTHTLTKRANMHGTKAQRWSGNESRQAMSVR